MNDFPAKCNLFFKGCDLCRIARLPSALGNHASTMGADVFGVSQLSRIDWIILDVAKMHNNSDRETLFHSSVESVGDGHIRLRSSMPNSWRSGLEGHLLQLCGPGRLSGLRLVNIGMVRRQSIKNLNCGSSKLTMTLSARAGKLRTLGRGYDIRPVIAGSFVARHIA
jgi:hypothetical protein